MFGLALGIARVGDTLPAPVYYLLSGLNSATVGLIALAGMQLSVRAITDSLSRTVLIVTACAGLCYTALWYFPALMAASGLTTVIWDLFLKKALRRFQRRLRSIIHRIRQRDSTSSPTDSEHSLRSVEVGDNAEMNNSSSDKAEEPSHSNAQEVDTRRSFTIAVLPGIIAIVLFFASFITLVVIRSVYAKYVQLRLFTNMVLAGTQCSVSGVLSLMNLKGQSFLEVDLLSSLCFESMSSKRDGYHRETFFSDLPSFRPFLDQILTVSFSLIKE